MASLLLLRYNFADCLFAIEDNHIVFGHESKKQANLEIVDKL